MIRKIKKGRKLLLATFIINYLFAYLYESL